MKYAAHFKMLQFAMVLLYQLRLLFPRTQIRGFPSSTHFPAYVKVGPL
jgi:hypothetical protein